MSLALFCSSLLGAGCVHELPPAATPEEVAPDVGALNPVSEGRGQLVIDVVDGPTPIQQLRLQAELVDDGKGRQSYRFYDRFEMLCPSSPCVADLPVGNVVLGIPRLGDGRLETELVHVSAEPTVYRRALSWYEGGGAGMILGILSATFGGMSATVGAVLLPIGLANQEDGMITAGAITLGVGAALIGLGILGMALDPSTYQPGSAVHFPLAR